MASILDEIVAYKRRELDEYKDFISEDTIISYIESADDEPRGFFRALLEAQKKGSPAVIAEVKKASPSSGIIRPDDFVPEQIARSYAESGAICLSVLTERKFFQGSALYLRQVRQAVNIPVLRKDFIIDDYQILESRALGADCVLLIASILSDTELLRMNRMAFDLGMDVLVEVHTYEEWQRTRQLPLRMIGVNNRNLQDFSVNLQTSFDLREKIPNDILVVSESGIETHQDLENLQKFGINAFLVGGSLMKAQDPGIALWHLING